MLTSSIEYCQIGNLSKEAVNHHTFVLSNLDPQLFNTIQEQLQLQSDIHHQGHGLHIEEHAGAGHDDDYEDDDAGAGGDDDHCLGGFFCD